MEKKRLFFLMVVVGMMLASCVGGDPYAMIAQGNAALQSTSAALISTQQAATMEAQATQQAYQVAQNNLAYSVEATKAAQELAARDAVATAAAGQVTQWAEAAKSATDTAAPIQAQATAYYMASLALKAENEAREAQWHALTTPITSTLPAVLGVTVLILLVIGAVIVFWRLLPIMEMRASAISADKRVMIYAKDRIIDPSRMFDPVLVHSGHHPHQAGGVDPLLQAMTTANAQQLDRERWKRPAVIMPGAGAGLAQAPAPAMGPELAYGEEWGPEAVPDHTPAPAAGTKPAWGDTLASWTAAQGLPLGVGEAGLVLADPEMYPHFLFAGTTGSGKTRSGLRPLAAAALAAGWQVCIFDPSLLDFLPFKNCANAHMVKLEEPAAAIMYLMAAFNLVRERQAQLAAAGVSTWGRLRGAGPRVMLVVDEFSNLADSQEEGGQKELWRAARMVAAEGRKAGVHLAIALQDPSYKSLDPRIRRNMIPVAFRVRDDVASRVVLNRGGAELLNPGEFLAGLGLDLVQGMGFSPADDELGAWLQALDVPQLAPPVWLDYAGAESAGRGAVHDHTPAPAGDDKADKVRALAAQGKSLAQIAREVFGYAGGAAFEKVKAILGGVA